MDVALVGSYQIRLDLKDNNHSPLKKSYYFTIEVTKYNPS